MKILIKADDEAIAQRVKELLESFGHGLHIYTKDDGISYYGCVIGVGDCRVFVKPDLFVALPVPRSAADWESLQKDLWAFYRDHLKDTVGNRCSCGLFEFCHCH
ncbi:MAG: hypothetical protein HUK02_06280 [Bacteroidaceae bacterium]|nr:hypothetical protein [Bacteroidaceae bacterium]